MQRHLRDTGTRGQSDRLRAFLEEHRWEAPSDLLIDRYLAQELPDADATAIASQAEHDAALSARITQRQQEVVRFLQTHDSAEWSHEAARKLGQWQASR